MAFKLPKIHKEDEEEEELLERSGLNEVEDLDKQQDLQALNASVQGSDKAARRRRRQDLLADRQPEGSNQTASMKDVLQAQQKALGEVQESITNEGQASAQRFARNLSRLAARKMPREQIQGKLLPKARSLRNPLLDKMPLNGEDLGLSARSFLLKRQITEDDWLSQLESSENDLLGSNLNGVQEFLDVFKRGKSKIDDPKMDLAPNLRASASARRNLQAQQILRNLHSESDHDKQNAADILRQLNLHSEDLESLQEEREAWQDETWQKKIESLLSR